MNKLSLSLLLFLSLLVLATRGHKHCYFKSRGHYHSRGYHMQQYQPSRTFFSKTSPTAYSYFIQGPHFQTYFKSQPSSYSYVKRTRPTVKHGYQHHHYQRKQTIPVNYFVPVNKRVYTFSKGHEPVRKPEIQNSSPATHGPITSSTEGSTEPTTKSQSSEDSDEIRRLLDLGLGQIDVRSNLTPRNSFNAGIPETQGDIDTVKEEDTPMKTSSPTSIEVSSKKPKPIDPEEDGAPIFKTPSIVEESTEETKPSESEEDGRPGTKSPPIIEMSTTETSKPNESEEYGVSHTKSPPMIELSGPNESEEDGVPVTKSPPIVEMSTTETSKPNESEEDGAPLTKSPPVIEVSPSDERSPKGSVESDSPMTELPPTTEVSEKEQNPEPPRTEPLPSNDEAVSSEFEIIDPVIPAPSTVESGENFREDLPDEALLDTDVAPVERLKSSTDAIQTTVQPSSKEVQRDSRISAKNMENMGGCLEAVSTFMEVVTIMVMEEEAFIPPMEEQVHTLELVDLLLMVSMEEVELEDFMVATKEDTIHLTMAELWTPWKILMSVVVLLFLVSLAATYPATQDSEVTVVETDETASTIAEISTVIPEEVKEKKDFDNIKETDSDSDSSEEKYHLNNGYNDYGTFGVSGGEGFAGKGFNDYGTFGKNWDKDELQRTRTLFSRFASRDPGIGAFPGYSIETPFGRRCWTGSKKLCCNNEFFQTFNIDLRGNNATEKAPTTERDSRFLDDNNSRKEPPSFPRQPGNPNFGPEGFGEIPTRPKIPGDITDPQRGLPPPGRQPNRFNPERPQGNYLPPRFPDN
ncbi:unnamed protein product [Notodromas monacha]|uniref:Uncharacterized protein n=1 Tax=Notodromas monacha TaxID=399045 RepID=A0A7R9BTF8_9CRUS|nr:unnamed protein product [Notodromas monacha]CAG0921428.1 unnamed protein product [Notodromas monacha]